MASPPDSVAAVIPAYNEERTIGRVVDTALSSRLVDEVVVVDNGSEDRTADVAVRHGARVVELREGGKGEAMAAGVAATGASVIVFLDADLTGLRSTHVDRLAEAILTGGAGMSCGLFDRGPRLNRIFLRTLPILTGQRGMRREVFESLDLEAVRGYKVEAALNSLCAQRALPIESFVCDGLFHVVKETKYRTPVEGFVRKIAMFVAVGWSYLSYQLRRRLPRRAAPVRLAERPIRGEAVRPPAGPASAGSGGTDRRCEAPERRASGS